MATFISKDRRSSMAPAKPAAMEIRNSEKVSTKEGLKQQAMAGSPSRLLLARPFAGNHVFGPGLLAVRRPYRGDGVRLFGMANCWAGSTAREWRLRPSAAVFKTAANFATISDTDLFTRFARRQDYRD
jgi:hypothetical protein